MWERDFSKGDGHGCGHHSVGQSLSELLGDRAELLYEAAADLGPLPRQDQQGYQRARVLDGAVLVSGYNDYGSLVFAVTCIQALCCLPVRYAVYRSGVT